MRRLSVLFILLLVNSLCVLAQEEAKVKSFTQLIDHIPSGDRKNDFNNVPCALVKIQVVDDIERIEGNKIGDVIIKGVEKWVYMCKGSRNMRIHLKNHLPVRVMFQDYKISGLQSNRVYELVLDVKTPIVEPSVKAVTGFFRLEKLPTGAKVTISSEQMQPKVYAPQQDGRLEVSLPYGRYSYTATADGFREANGSIFVNDEGQWQSVTLDPITGTLDVSCLTRGVEFYVNGLWESNKAFTKSVAPGQYFVEARKKKLSQGQMVTVVADQTTVVEIPSLKKKRTNAATEELSMNDILQKENNKESTSENKREPVNTEVDKAVKAEKDTPVTEAPEQEKTTEKKSEEVQVANKTSVQTLPLDIEQEKNPYIGQETKTEQKSSKKGKTLVWGLRAGLNLASLNVDEDEGENAEYKTSLHFGVSADIAMTKFLHLNTGLFYSQKGYRFKCPYYLDYYETLEEDATAQFFMLPLQLSLRLGRFQINAGPYAEYCVGGNIKLGYPVNDEIPTFDYYDPSNYGIVCGIGVILGKHFYIGANWESGLSDYANKNLTISLGYNF